MFKKANKKGFTLIELIIVVAIMAVLVALLAPNVLKYLEKSKFGKDVNSLDTVRLAIEAELMDEELSSMSTGGKWVKLSDIANAKADTTKLYDDLKERLFGEAMVLSDEFKVAKPFSSKAAKDAEICVYIDGNGGVAVAGITTSSTTTEGTTTTTMEIAEYNGEELIVSTKINKDFTGAEGFVTGITGE